MTSRRTFLIESARTAAGLVAIGAIPARRDDGATWRAVGNPFLLGVASGDPAPDGIVLWTRLLGPARAPLTTPAVKVRWEIAEDDQMRRIVRRGEALARPELGHSVHVEVEGLQSSRDYWYRFDAGGEGSAIAKTRTAPPTRAPVDRLKFAFVSCQNWQQGYFTAFRHVADEQLDFVVHLGDYIYEDGPRERSVRQHDGPEPITLDQYRTRYSLYKSDPDLQAAHARHPFILTWDDHEVANNYAGAVPNDSMPTTQFLARRAAAYQAYYEHLPIRRTSMPAGPNAQMYRALGMGNLAAFIVLDTRQYRTDQPCGDGRKARCPANLDPAATITGPAQEKWMLDTLTRSTARWNVIANQVPFSQIDNVPGPGAEFSMDKWDGYVAQRRRIADFLGQRKPSNPLILTGDMHFSMVLDVKRDFDTPSSETVGTELVGTSISSGSDGVDLPDFGKRMLEANPHMRFMNQQRGYVRCDLTPDRCATDYRIVPFVTREGAPIETRASFIIENGRPGAASA
jgi:alkaline phosphatase D